MKAVIFLGPSLPLHEARDILDAVYLPPVGQTDLVTATVNHQPDVIGMIDGFFLHSLSVWHKEVLYVLEQGLPIYGASSMGALRAAETAAFGMIGVGKIFQMYASGELMDDDEVALAHASADQGYRKISEPMVNVRATLEAAERAGVISPEQRQRLVAIAKAIYFTDRTMDSILKAAVSDGMPVDLVRRLTAFVATGYVDLKRQDAIELLHAIKDHLRSGTPRASGPAFDPRHSTAFETLYNRDREVEHRGQSIALESISNYVALHDPEFDDVNFNALNRALLFNLSDVLGIETPEDAIDAECLRFRKRRELTDDAALTAWLADNHLSHRELRDLMSQIVACRALHRWFLIAVWMGRTTKIVLDELRLRGSYPDWMKRAVAQERLLDGVPERDGSGTSSRSLDDFLEEHLRWTDCRVDIAPRAWAEEVGFHAESNLKAELCRASAARRALLELLGDSGQPHAHNGRSDPPGSREPAELDSAP